MKRLTTFLLTLLLFTLGASAQSVHECEAEFSHWSIAGNSGGSFQLNTWSTEDDPSGMKTPFIEYWVGTGNKLSNATISHTQLIDLEDGYYSVSIFGRAFNEGSKTDIAEGTIFFNANEESIDITTGTIDVWNGTSAEAYGTYTLLVYVTNGTLDINFSINGTNCDWFAFKNLSVTYFGKSMPTLAAVEGVMNAEVEAAMQDAVDAYNANKNAEAYYAALAAIEAAEASIDYYAPIVAAVAALDEAGAAVWAESDYAEALADRTLTNEDVSADLAAAQIVQTTAGSDMSYVLKATGEWKHDTASSVGNFQICPALSTAHEAWRGTTFGGSADSPSMPLYKEIEDLPEGTYEISFYAYAAQGTAGDVIVFANDASSTIEVDATSVGPNWSNEHELITLICEVGEDGILQFGMKCIGAGAWYVCEECSLTMLTGEEPQPEDTPSDYQPGDVITVDGVDYTVLGENLVPNHSFELGFTGWTGANDFTTEITSSKFDLKTDGAEDGEQYLVGTTNSGSNSDGSLGKAWAIEANKTYYFFYWVKNLDGTEETDYLKTSLTNTPGTETKELGYPASVSADWQKVEYVFDSESYEYVQVKFRWLENHWGFDNFQIYEVEEIEAEETEPEDVHECEAEFSHWSIAGNSGGSFQLNTWSTEDDPSGMKTPFIEYWVGTGNKLSNATISHTQLIDLEDGYYSVSIFGRAFNEGSKTDIAEGTIFFNANEESIDITTGTIDVWNGTSAEAYGTYTLLVYVTDGTLDINFSINGTNCDWFAFKNLSVTYFGKSMPTLAAVEGVMNAEVEAAMQDAVDAYNANKNAETYYAALAAIEAAEASIDYYAPIVAAVAALDEAGAAVWAESDYAEALENRTLTNEDVSAALAAAQIVQTTAGSDMSYVLTSTGSWTAAQGNGPAPYTTGTETYCDPAVTALATTGKVLYKTIEGLPAGTYSVSFYAAANHCNGIEGASGDDLTVVYANDATAALTVGTLSAITLGDDYLYTIECTVGEDGKLEFGIENIDSPCGNWYVAQAISLTMLTGEEAEPVDGNDNDYEVGDVVTVDGKECTIVGENLFVNGGFGDGVNGWKANLYTEDAVLDNFTYATEGGYNDGAYITIKANGGAVSVNNLSQAIAVEEGKTYLFVGYTNGTAPGADNKRYNGVMQMSDATTEILEEGKDPATSHDAIVEVQMEWGAEDEWTQTIGVFTASTPYVGVRTAWCSGASFDGFQIYEVEVAEEVEPEPEPVEDGTYAFVCTEWSSIDLGRVTDDNITYDEASNTITVNAGTGDNNVALSNGREAPFTTAEYTISEDQIYFTVIATDISTAEGASQLWWMNGYNGGMTADPDKIEVFVDEDGNENGVVLVAWDISAYVTAGEDGMITLDGWTGFGLTSTTGTSVISDINFYTATELNGVVTAIGSVKADNEPAAAEGIYTLSGVRLNKITKSGIYIVDGKKVLVK